MTKKGVVQSLTFHTFLSSLSFQLEQLNMECLQTTIQRISVQGSSAIRSGIEMF